MIPMFSNYEIFLRLLMAAVLSGLIGFERERLSWYAGLRTHMLVGVGAALIMIVSQYGFNEVLRQQLVILDPSRVAAQVVSGIGFLGAGTILFWREAIRGLTTAASLWAVAAIGLAVGGGLYLAAFNTTALLLLILVGIKPLEKRFLKKHRRGKEIKFSIKTGLLSLVSLEEMLSHLDPQIKPTEFHMEVVNGQEVFHLLFDSASEKILFAIMDEIRKFPGVEKIDCID